MVADYDARPRNGAFTLPAEHTLPVGDAWDAFGEDEDELSAQKFLLQVRYEAPPPPPPPVVGWL